MKRFSTTLVLIGALSALILVPAGSALGAADPHAAKVYVAYADTLRGDALRKAIRLVGIRVIGRQFENSVSRNVPWIPRRCET